MDNVMPYNTKLNRQNSSISKSIVNKQENTSRNLVLKMILPFLDEHVNTQYQIAEM